MEIKELSNLQQLKDLVDTLEGQDKISKEYSETLSQIQTLIKEEKKIINKLKRPDAKLKHYESICSGILAIIGTN